MKIGLLTSSRADYGIYFSLIEGLVKQPAFQLEIIAFGTHLSKFHGYTLENIQKHVPQLKIHTISTLITNDDEEAISTSYGLTCLKFADFWKHQTFDLVFCLGDRFEMSAAVQAAIPFGVKFAHIHGGETTLGAIDNIYRHQITLASKWHFASTEHYKNRIIEILGTQEHIYSVGALSLDDLNSFLPTPKELFLAQYNIIDPFILITFHPETVSSEQNENFSNEMYHALAQLQSEMMLVITMPNADTLGSVYRNQLIQLKNNFPDNIILIENFGKQNYFSAMHYCQLMIGNTSSGIIEAASFGKYVVNVGNRQLGRAQSENCLTVPFEANEIIKQTHIFLSKGFFLGENIYQKSNVAQKIINLIAS